LETDLAVSQDGVLVISHDPALNPDIICGPDGQFLGQTGPVIWRKSYTDLRQYDVGRLKTDSRYAAQYPQHVAHDGARIPRLQDLFDLVQRSGNRDVRFALEIKTRPDAPNDTLAPSPFAAMVVDAVRAAGLAERTTILSFDWRALQAVQRAAPDIGTVYLSIQQRNFDNIGAGRATGSAWTAGIAHADHLSVPKWFMPRAGASGLPFIWISTPQSSRKPRPWASPYLPGRSTSPRGWPKSWTWVWMAS
jgi:glycerophosphoryl diester phosphodiesterase